MRRREKRSVFVSCCARSALQGFPVMTFVISFFIEVPPPLSPASSIAQSRLSFWFIHSVSNHNEAGGCTLIALLDHSEWTSFRMNGIGGLHDVISKSQSENI